MINKVVIAAAGRGTRMLHLTDNKPKQLIEVNGKPFLFYVLEDLSKAGCREIYVVGGYMGDLIRKLIRQNPVLSASATGEFSVKFIDQYKKFNPDVKYGTAVALECAREFVGEGQFLFICGDNLYSVEDLKAMTNTDDEFCYVAGIESEHPEKYGVLINDGEFLEKVVEKPKEFVGSLINAGIYKFTPEIFDKISEIKKSPRGEYEITDAISFLAKEKKVKIKKINSWLDFGKPEDIEKISKFLKNAGNKK